MRLARAVLNKAVLWGWLPKVPAVRMLPEPSSRVRWITRQEADSLIQALPPWLADMAEFSLQTGLRRHNVTHLKWSEVDLPSRRLCVHADEAKAGKAIAVPLSEVALSLLRKRLFNGSSYVFAVKGKPVIATSCRPWYRCLAEVGIDNFRWHDLRHTWASWHVQRGTPLHVLKELGGWADYEMVLKYAHLSCDHLSEWVNPEPLATLLATAPEKELVQSV